MSLERRVQRSVSLRHAQSAPVRFHAVAATCMATAALLCAVPIRVYAGDLNPPAGPVAPTMKTLTEVEPRTAVNAINTPGDADSLFKITQPGSYYFTGNVAGVSGKSGIEIEASGVTLDLMGFDLVGVAGSLDGVRANLVAPLVSVAVVNGSVRNWGGSGVDLGGVFNTRLADLRVSDNGIVGIGAGTNAVVVSGCVAYQNGSVGISAGTNSSVTACAADRNGSDGISVGGGSTVSHCSARFNTNNGISFTGGGAITDCSAQSNDGIGISTINGRATIAHCSVEGNTLDGIRTGSSSTIINCTASFNTLDGIVVGSDCTVRGNTSDSNGFGGDGAGIHVGGADNLIEGNNFTDNDRGIDADAAGNLIARNTCSGNTTNWDIVIGNAVAPIVQASTNAAAISGNTYAGSLGSTDPNANFTY